MEDLKTNLLETWFNPESIMIKERKLERKREDGGLAREKSDSGNTDGTEFHSDRVWIR